MALPIFFLNDDSRMLEALRKGEEAPLHTLYKTCMPMVRRYVTANSGDPDDAADMLQDALVILWENVRSGRYTHSSKLSTYVMGTVNNLWHRRLARKRKELSGIPDDDILPAEDPDPLDQLEEHEDAVAISRALDRLGEPCKTLLLLFYWEELSMEEIAGRMGFANADTAKARKHQCKKNLTRIVMETAGNDD